jgi:YbbR domain-containing protein
MLSRPFSFLARNWETFLLAFLLSVAVWVSAVVASDPNQEAEYPRSIQLEVVGLSEDLRILGNLPESVTISIRAPQSLWINLQNNPDLISASIDLSDLDPGEWQVPVEVEFEIFPVELISVEPETVSVTLEREISVQFPVQIIEVGELALGYEIQGTSLSPEIVTVTGPESLVSQVSEVQGWITINDARDDIMEILNLIAVDQNGRQISGVDLSPSEVTVTLTIVQSGGYREVVVRVETVGTLPSGYRLTNISVSPPTITVFSSNPQAVAEMPGFVSTEPIYLQDYTDDVELRLALVLPEDVERVGDEQSVVVQIGIAAIETTISLSLPIQIVELGPGLSATLSPETIEVFLTGPLTVLEALTPDDVIVSISLAGLDVGTHLAITQVEVLTSGVVIESVNPDTIEVVITEAVPDNDQSTSSESTPTPSPSP